MTTRVEESVVVHVPVRTAYDQWTQFEDFPLFMKDVDVVEQLDPIGSTGRRRCAGSRASGMPS